MPDMSERTRIPRLRLNENSSLYTLRLKRHLRTQERKRVTVKVEVPIVKEEKDKYSVQTEVWILRTACKSDEELKDMARQKIEAEKSKNDIWEGVIFDPSFFMNSTNVNDYLAIPPKWRKNPIK